AWLPWVAFLAMTAAGIIAAVDPGSGALSRTGAFSAQAQACALIALAAVLVPVLRRRSEKTDASVVPAADSEGSWINSTNGHAKDTEI
ncbi:MAG TPA: hypothetical protein VHS97_09535, partial [Isosphaeraceae bacterium]|nr:hypothetical protein [Isosphaeraceae bacterium]